MKISNSWRRTVSQRVNIVFLPIIPYLNLTLRRRQAPSSMWLTGHVEMERLAHATLFTTAGRSKPVPTSLPLRLSRAVFTTLRLVLLCPGKQMAVPSLMAPCWVLNSPAKWPRDLVLGFCPRLFIGCILWNRSCSPHFIFFLLLTKCLLLLNSKHFTHLSRLFLSLFFSFDLAQMQIKNKCLSF